MRDDRAGFIVNTFPLRLSSSSNDRSDDTSNNNRKRKQHKSGVSCPCWLAPQKAAYVAILHLFQKLEWGLGFRAVLRHSICSAHSDRDTGAV